MFCAGLGYREGKWDEWLEKGREVVGRDELAVWLREGVELGERRPKKEVSHEKQ